MTCIRYLTACAVLTTVLSSSVPALEGTALFWGASWKPNKGVYLVDVDAGTGRMILDEGTNACFFHPDGRQIFFNQGGNWWLMNNDGTDKTLFYDGGDINPAMGGTGIKWVQAGIFWQESGGGVYRMDPSTKDIRLVATVTGDYYQGLWVTHDGSRCVVWTRNNETEHHYPMIDFGSNWDSYDVRWVDVWGHGWHLVMDGSYVIVDDWRGVCNSTPVCTDYGSHLTFVVYDWDLVGPESSDGIVKSFPSNTDGEQVGTHDVHPCLNNDSYFAFMGGGCRWTPDENGCDDPQRAWVTNWETETTTEILGFPAHYMYIGGYWHGPLPSPVATEPVISLSTSSLSFLDDGGAIAPQTVTVTNTGIGTLAKVDVAVSPASSWLTVTVEGSGGNTQTVSNSVDVSGLTAGAHTATVTVSGGGAGNTRSYTVTLNVAMSVAAPTGLGTAIGGSELRDVTLSWTDNSDNETAFAIERKTVGGSWAEIAETAADAVSYVDGGVPCGDYVYRVRARADTAYSDYSDSALAAVVGLPWVSVDAPLDGDTLLGGADIHIQWTTNIVSNVEIHFTTDEGESWTAINPDGGISESSPSWGDFVWTVPDTAAGTILIRVKMYQSNDYSDQTGPLVVVTSDAVGHQARRVASDRSVLRPGSRTVVTDNRRVVCEVNPGETAILEVLLLDGSRVAAIPLTAGRESVDWQRVRARTSDPAVGACILRVSRPQ